MGLALMAFFTAVWTAWAYSSSGGWFLTLAVAFWLVAVALAVNSVLMFRALRRFPTTVGADADEEGRVIGRRFGIVFAAEGIAIGIVCGVLGPLGLYQYIAPAISLVVGAHFIPLAWVFQRRADVWLGSFTAAVGVAGVITVAMNPDGYLMVWTIVGFTTAAVTITYGVLMSVAKQGMLIAALAQQPAPRPAH